MRLLLLKDVRKLGHLGDVVDVSAGYARNYLLPQRLATEPTEENLKAIEQDKIRAAAERAARLKRFQAVAAAMADVSISIEVAANPEGTLYGSVGPREIGEALRAHGHPVEDGFVELDAPIRTLDNRMVTIRFADDVAAQVKVWVVRAGSLNHAEGAPADGTTAEPQPAE